MIALLLASALAKRPAPPEEPARVVVFVRHAEKLDDSRDPPLSPAGLARADCLADVLGPFAPTRVLHSQYQRTAATVAPLVARLGVTPEVIDASEPDALRRALVELPPGGRALVAGHSDTVPALVAALGGELTDLDARGNLPHHAYDRVIHVVLGSAGRSLAVYETRACAPSTAPTP